MSALTVFSGNSQLFFHHHFASIVAIVMMMKKGKAMKYALPFGPFLSLGAEVYLFWGRARVNFFY